MRVQRAVAASPERVFALIERSVAADMEQEIGRAHV